MNILKWIAVIVVAYTLGYFSHYYYAESLKANTSFISAGCPSPLSAGDGIDKALIEEKESIRRLQTAHSATAMSSAAAGDAKKNATLKAHAELPPTQGNPNAAPGAGASQVQSSSVPASNITDAEIDKLVPTPFNETLKGIHGPIREKYKEFAESDRQTDWDRNSQNKITDALSGNPYSKFLEIDSVSCKVNFCEVRGRESKSQVINLIFSEMMLQDWWDMGQSHLTSGGQNNSFYILLMKR